MALEYNTVNDHRQKNRGPQPRRSSLPAANSIFVLNYWSPDGGNTWVPLTDGIDSIGSAAFLDAASYGSLGEAIAATSPQTLFIVSFENGLWRFPIGP